MGRGRPRACSNIWEGMRWLKDGESFVRFAASTNRMASVCAAMPMPPRERDGVRPERRNFYRPKPDREKPQSEAPSPAQSTRKGRVTKAVDPDRRFLRSLQGVWYSDQKKLRVNIDLAQNCWAFTFSSGQRLVQIWCPVYLSSKKLTFVRDDKEITAQIGRGRVLMMTGKDEPVPFVNLQAGKKHRLCKRCFVKSEWRYKACQRRKRSFW